MTDRELLEAAAKAAGIEALLDSVGIAWLKWPSFSWNPLTDDGDALRLAAKMKMDIAIFDGRTVVDVPGPIRVEETGKQPAATRRAIVRAAAAMAVG